MHRVLALVAVAVTAGLGFAQETAARIDAKCAGEWPGDYEMRAFCERNQWEAVAELQQLKSTQGGIPTEAFKVSLVGCVGEWPDDFEMQAFCLKNQIEGYAEVARGPSSAMISLTPEESAVIAAHCAQEWAEDYEMQAYCGTKQADGVAFLRSRPLAVSQTIWSASVHSCEADWPNNYEMQAFCVRQSLY